MATEHKSKLHVDVIQLQKVIADFRLRQYDILGILTDRGAGAPRNIVSVWLLFMAAPLLVLASFSKQQILFNIFFYSIPIGYLVLVWHATQSWSLIFKFLFPRLVVAVMGGWSFITSSELLLRYSLAENVRFTAFSFSLAIVALFVFIFFELRKTAPYVGFGRKIVVRILCIISIAFMTAYYTGAFFQSFFNAAFLDNNRLFSSLGISLRHDHIRQELKTSIDALGEDMLVLRRPGYRQIVDINQMLEHVRVTNDSLINRMNRIERENRLYADRFPPGLSVRRYTSFQQALKDSIAHYASQPSEASMAYSKSVDRWLKDEMKMLQGDHGALDKSLDSLQREFAGMTFFSKPSKHRLSKDIYLYLQNREYCIRLYFPGEVVIFPKSLLFLTVLVMFFGVFFELLLQGRSITDPL